MSTLMSGKADMNHCATSVMAARPTAGSSSFTRSEPFGAKKAATLAASSLHQAAVYRCANSRRLSESAVMRPPSGCLALRGEPRGLSLLARGRVLVDRPVRGGPVDPALQRRVLG